MRIWFTAAFIENLLLYGLGWSSCRGEGAMNMQIGWLVDAVSFPRYCDKLVAVIRKHGHAVELANAPPPPYRWDDIKSTYRSAFPAGACVITHGDIELVTRVRREQHWIPGAFCSLDHFHWSHYACHFGPQLLNRDYLLLPFGELSRLRALLFKIFGRDGRIFVRPNSPLKLFTGQLASVTSFDADLEFMGFYEFPPDSLVVVARPQQISHEWRFVVAQGEVVAGSQYRCEGKLDCAPICDSAATAFASRVCRLGYEPDPVWILDVCRTAEGEYAILEIGGFSFSDLYSCDLDAVVPAVSAAAAEAWRNAQP